MEQLSLDVIVTRGAQVESRHRVHAAVVNASGSLVASARDASLVTHWRSCAKWPTYGYERHDHPVQQGCLAEVAKWAGVSRESIALAVDGCGVTEFALGLEAMALAYARLADAARRSSEIPSRIVHAMQTRP